MQNQTFMKNELSDYTTLFNDIIRLIEQGKEKGAITVNAMITMVYWQVGKRINEEVLKGERAAYGIRLWTKSRSKKIGKTIASSYL